LLDVAYAWAYSGGMAATATPPTVGMTVSIGTDFVTGAPVTGTVTEVVDDARGRFAVVEVAGDLGSFTFDLPW
jgi:hypothetical protein